MLLGTPAWHACMQILTGLAAAQASSLSLHRKVAGMKALSHLASAHEQCTAATGTVACVGSMSQLRASDTSWADW